MQPNNTQFAPNGDINGTLRQDTAKLQKPLSLQKTLKHLTQVCNNPLQKMLENPKLTGILGQIALGQGVKVALQLVKTCGGQVLSIPSSQRLKEKHPLKMALGARAAQRCCEDFQGEIVYIPTLTKLRKQIRDSHIITAARLGATAPELAKASRLTVRQIYSILSGHEAPVC